MLRHLIRQRGISFHFGCATQSCKHYGTKKTEDEIQSDKEWMNRDVPEERPFDRAMRALKKDMRHVKKKVFFWKDHSRKPNEDQWVEQNRSFPEHVDVLVIGGGAMGSSVAYWLKKRADDGLHVAVVERDPSYKEASTCLSVGGLRQQFSLEENIEMSLFGADFLRDAERLLGIPGEAPVDLQFNPYGYLTLATEAGAETLQRNSKLQNELGAKNVILTASQLKSRFPWLNTEDIAVGCLGLEKEGWFDPWALLYGLKRKAVSLGAEYVTGEVMGFTYRNISDTLIGETRKSTIQGLKSAIIKTPDGERKTITFAICVIAAGAHSGEVARMAKIGEGEGILTVPLPVEPRKRYAYCFHAPDGPGLNTPLTIDPTGAYFRREGLANHYIAGKSPCFEDEPSIDNLDVDDKFFDEQIWPTIANRVKAFENIKLKSSWAGYYEYNKFDQNGIIGQHPVYNNLFFATGFSGHGIQQSPAVGRAITELIIDCNFLTIDLTKFGFDRFITLEPMKEACIV